MAAASQPYVIPRKPAQSASRECDFAPEFRESPRTRYTPGIYTLRCIDVRPRHMFGAHKLELRFQFPASTNCVFAYLHLGRGPEPEVRPGSNYAKLWLEATGGKKSRRMSAKIFKWAWFELEIGDVLKDHEGRPHAEPYSVVKRIIRLTQR